MPNIVSNVISNNDAVFYGGGIYIYESPAVIKYNVINGNTSNSYGGALYMRNNPPAEVFGNVIFGNSTWKGGGFYIVWCDATVTNNLIFENLADKGGGVFNIHSFTSFVNCTVANNDATIYGGGFYYNRSKYTWIRNCIIWGNALEQIYITVGHEPTVSYSDIQGGWTGTENINHNPYFIDGPWGDYYLAQTAAGQPLQSFCVDHGDPNDPRMRWATRTDCEPDLGIVDMGFHYPYFLSNSRVIPAVGTEQDLYTYYVDIMTPEAEPPSRVYLMIDDQYAGEMTLLSGCPGYGTYTYSTYLQGLGRHEAIFVCELSGRTRLFGDQSDVYRLPTEAMDPFLAPVIRQVVEVGDHHGQLDPD